MARKKTEPKFKIFILNNETYKLPIHSEARLNWRKTSKKQRERFATAYCDHYQIKTTSELHRGPHRLAGLLVIIRKDGAIAKVFRREHDRQQKLGGETITIFLKTDGKVDWERMEDDASLRYIRAYCREFAIKGIADLSRGTHKFPGMARIISDHGWTDLIFPRPPDKEEILNGKIHRLPLHHNSRIMWRNVSEKVFRDYFADYCHEKNIGTRADMPYDSLLATEARRRNLFDELLPPPNEEKIWCGHTLILPKRGKKFYWSRLSDADALLTAQAYVWEFDIKSPTEMIRGSRRNKGMYNDLRRRGLFAKVFGHPDCRFETLDGDLFVLPRGSIQRINWRRVSDELVEKYSRAYIRHYGTDTQAELKVKNASLLILLRRRGLLKKLFPDKIDIIELAGRRFSLPTRGRYILWERMEPEVLNIYVAARCREEKRKLCYFSCSLIARIDRAKVRAYRKHLPILNTETRQSLCAAFGVMQGCDLPDEILWAYGYEKKADPRIRARWIQKIQPPPTPIT